MLKLTDFIAAIQSAIDSAAQMVAQQNFHHLSTYFQQQSASGEDKTGSATSAEALPDDAVLRPRMVTMVYPKDTSKGVVEHHVQVPLLSLAPIANLQPEEINIEIDLEFLEQGDQLMVGFPQVKRNMLGRENVVQVKPNAKLTMRISTSSRPAGITAIIEGYDKSLRAQIPN